VQDSCTVLHIALVNGGLMGEVAHWAQTLEWAGPPANQ
jgi:hypothetical protein